MANRLFQKKPLLFDPRTERGGGRSRLLSGGDDIYKGTSRPGERSQQDFFAAQRDAQEGESYDPAAPAPLSQNVPVKPSGSLVGRDDTLRDTLTGTIDKGLRTLPYAGSGRSSYDFSKKLMGLAEFNPVVGAATSAGDVYDAAKRGDKSEMATGALFTGLNLLGAKPMVAAAKGAMRGRTFPWGELDPFKPLVQHSDNALPGAPTHVPGPVANVDATAAKYAKDRGFDLKRQKTYAEADPTRGRYIAEAYDQMKHDPQDPKVAAAYKSLADETMAQWRALQEAGAKIDFIKPGEADPYPGGPREALADLQNNHHLYVFPTNQGFGSSDFDPSTNPLLASTGINHGGHDMVVNDAFRAVHDYFGHGMEGANFGARGEENAWRAHSRLFSPEAMPALTSETRGQNSWVNFGPHGEANRANQKDTIYADQKTGLLPEWAQRERGMPLKHRLKQSMFPLFLGGALGASAMDER